MDWEKIGKGLQAGVKREYEQKMKNIHSSVKAKLRNCSDEEFQRIYDTRYNRPNVIEEIESEARRRGIY